VQDGDADVAGGVDWCGWGLGVSWRVLGRVGEGKEGRYVPLGWNIGVWNVIFGGRWGYSGGKVRWAR